MIIIMAWRNIWRSKMRSIIIMFSISIGLFAGIAVLALYKGMMTNRVRNVIDTEVAHLQIHDSNFKKDYEPKYIIADGVAKLKFINTLPEVKSATARSVTQAMITTTTSSAGVQINGITPREEYVLSQLKNKIIEGKPFDSSKKNQVLIGKKLASKLKLKPGSKIVLTLSDTALNIVAGAFKVVAIYQSNNTPLDERNVYVTIQDLNTLLNCGNSFHEIAVLLKNDAALNSVKQKLQQQFPLSRIETWKDISPETELLVKTADQYSYIIMIIIMFALAFGIINTMLMAILERTREIGMMVALGTNRIKIFLLILLETFFLTLAGTPIGIFAGWITTKYYSIHGLDFSGMGREMMSSFGFSTLIYPEFPEEKIVAVLLIVSCTALLSCIFPAYKALRLQPVEALKR